MLGKLRSSSLVSKDPELRVDDGSYSQLLLHLRTFSRRKSPGITATAIVTCLLFTKDALGYLTERAPRRELYRKDALQS
jgi:hypothetical protein